MMSKSKKKNLTALAKDFVYLYKGECKYQAVNILGEHTVINNLCDQWKEDCLYYAERIGIPENKRLEFLNKATYHADNFNWMEEMM